MSQTHLIIGGSSGIGLELAKKLSRSGSRVINLSRNPSSEGIEHHPCDVLDDHPAFPNFTDPLQGLVYCPGSINLKPFGSLKEDDFIQDLKINLLGAVKTIRHFLPLLKKGKPASIVLFSTVAVAVGMPFHTSISSAKGAVEGFGKALAAELAPDIRVNILAPSLTDTPLAKIILDTEQKKEQASKRHPMHRFGNPSDLADMAQFLLSEKSGWITGQVLHIDGGFSTIKNL